MTSAPNLLLLLNGNRRCAALLFSCIFIFSCSSSSTSSARAKVIGPDPNRAEEPAESEMHVDTIQWTFNPEEDFPPISEASKVAAFALEKVEKEHYKIALLLPFRIMQDLPSLTNNNRRFADFYAGIKMAAESQTKISADVNVYYTDREESTLDKILNEISTNKPDLIIASYENNLISKTARFARENRIPIISPWKSSTAITEDNIYYLQMRPGIEHYFKRIVDHVNYNFEKDEVRIIQRNDGTDNAKTRLIHKIEEQFSALPLVSPMATFDISLDSLMESEAAVFDTAFTDGVKAFILPHYSSRDESFIYSCLRKMYGEKAGREFYVYTMPVALNSERIDINILKNLNIRTAEFRFPNPQDMDVKKFRKRFFQTYGWLPTEDAYYGYDLMSFVQYGLINHGQYFHYFMAGETLNLMQMKVNIQPFYKHENKERPDFMVNDHLYIIEFDKDHFEVRDIR